MKRLLTLLSILLLLLMSSCQGEIEKPIPKKTTQQSQGLYDKYLKLLKNAYASNDLFEAALQLANLHADPKVTFDLLNHGIQQNKDNCDRIYEWYHLYDKHDFATNLLKLDTTTFKKSVHLCDQILENTSYLNYATWKDQEEEHARQSKEKEDSTGYDMELVQQLIQIEQDDQDVRNKYSIKNMTPDLKAEMIKEMHLIDSINLDKIDLIFREYGYPSRALVGKEGNFIPALIIHHSNSLQTRYKYMPFLEKAVEDGLLAEVTLNMIKRRIEYMELEQEK